MGGKKKNTAKAASTADSDDALLEAAITENEQAKQENARAAAIAEEVTGRKLTAEQESRRRGLSQQQIIERLNVFPTFSVMRVLPTKKEYVSLTFKDNDSDKGLRCCPFFSEPADCKDALQQTQEQYPDMKLALGVLPLGHAFALAVGWATAESKAPFTLRGAPETAERLRSLLVGQLEEAHLPTHWHFPVFMCEDLNDSHSLPVFLTREQLAASWTASGKPGMPTGTLVVTDLRIVVGELQKSAQETGCDWSRVRFLGSNEGWQALQQGAEQADVEGAAAASLGGFEAGVLGIVGGRAAAQSQGRPAGKQSSAGKPPAVGDPDDPDSEAEPPELV